MQSRPYIKTERTAICDQDLRNTNQGTTTPNEILRDSFTENQCGKLGGIAQLGGSDTGHMWRLVGQEPSYAGRHYLPHQNQEEKENALHQKFTISSWKRISCIHTCKILNPRRDPSSKPQIALPKSPTILGSQIINPQSPFLDFSRNQVPKTNSSVFRLLVSEISMWNCQ